MVILRDVEVTISAKGKRLHEYDDAAEEPSPSNAVTKYIEALTGTDFHIQYTLKPAFRLKSSGISVHVTIDGEDMDNIAHPKHEDLKDLSRVPFHNYFDGSRRLQNGTWIRQAFIFSEIKTSRSPSTISFIY